MTINDTIHLGDKGQSDLCYENDISQVIQFAFVSVPLVSQITLIKFKV